MIELAGSIAHKLWNFHLYISEIWQGGRIHVWFRCISR